MNADLYGPATLLADGRVLVAGGENDAQMFADAQVYTPATRQWTNVGRLQKARDKHAATLLANGQVLVVGGADKNGWRGQMKSSEFFDPITGTFRAGPMMTSERFKLHASVVVLPGGRVAVAGGSNTIEVYDPKRGDFTQATGALDEPRYFSSATTLRDGSVLVAGGYAKGTIASTEHAWIYRDNPPRQ